MISRISITALVAAASLAAGTGELVAQTADAPAPPLIQRVIVDTETGELQLVGQRLKKSGKPRVKLGTQKLEVIAASKKRVRVALPPDVPQGGYLLRLTTGNDPADQAVWPLLENQFHDLCRGCHEEKAALGEDGGPPRECMACHLGDELP